MFLLVMKETGLHFLPLCNVPHRDYGLRVKETFTGWICRCLSGLRCQIFTSWLEVGWALHCLNGPALHCHSPSHRTGPGLEETHELSE